MSAATAPEASSGTVFITGITGMIGSHLAQHYRRGGYRVIGIARPSAAARNHAGYSEEILPCDILERSQLEALLSRYQPDIVLHMAAQAFNGISWETEDTTFLTNIQGTLNVLRAVQGAVPTSKVLLACSSAEYGMVPVEECPIVEERFLRPVSPYGVSKVAGENIGYQYHKTFGLQVYLPRLFIHVGTGHPPATAIQNFARQLARIAKGIQDPVVRVGSLTTGRDFIDVRDGAAAMALIVEKGRAGEPYNVCTGHAHSIRETLDLLIDISGLDVEVKANADLLRPADEPLLLGDNSKIRALGWQQRYTFRETLTDVYNDWLKRCEEQPC